MKFLFRLFLLGFILTSCSQDEIVLEESALPSISIESITSTSMDACEVVLSVNQGINAKTEKLSLIFKDINNPGTDPVTITVPLPVKRVETQNIKVELNKKNHIFDVQAKLETKDKIYLSNTRKVSFSLSDIDITLSVGGYYVKKYTTDDEQVEQGIMRNDSIFIGIYTKKTLFSTEDMQFLLDGKIPIKSRISSKYEDVVYVYAYIPENIKPGDYYVHLHTKNGMEIISESKIRVLDGKIGVFDDTYQDVRLSDLSWFILNDNAYFIGLNTYIYDPQLPFLNWCLNMKTKKWTKKKNFSSGINNQYHHTLSKNLQTKENAYLLVLSSNSRIDVLEYNESLDTWTTITSYPGIALTNVVSFIINQKLYIGGGTYYNHGESISYSDFWEYDLKQKYWKQKKDFSFENYGQSITCSSDEKGYYFSYRKYLWEYDPKEDQWIKKSQFTKGYGEYEYSNSSMAYLNDCIYIMSPVGHTHIIKYSLNENYWNLNSVILHTNQQIPFFAYQNKLYTGYIEEIYQHFANIYEITP